MLPIDSLHPFPLEPPGARTYAEAQLHSEAVDAWLGLKTEETEAAILGNEDFAADRGGHQGTEQNLWLGLPVKTLLTPYTEIRSMLAHLAPEAGTTVVDLGAGYGRMGFVIGRHYPQVRFIGYEYVAERVRESQRCLSAWSFPRVRMEQADLKAEGFAPASAEFYFLYDFGSRSAIEKTLEDLRQIARHRPITVIARGRASRDAIEQRHPWLSQVNPPEHFAHYSIYRS